MLRRGLSMKLQRQHFGSSLHNDGTDDARLFSRVPNLASFTLAALSFILQISSWISQVKALLPCLCSVLLRQAILPLRS